jgi:glutamate-1-semialdehyde 2,1-aminomutase
LVRDHILQHAAELRYLQFYGGEPLLLKGVETLLQHLVDMGVAPNITLFLHTNGTTTRAPWLRLTGEFKGLELGLSLDGVGLLNDYIRYPSKWSALVENLEVFRKLPRVSLWGGVVLQAYNALSIVELLRFLDAQGLPFYVLPLVVPQYLGVSVLPLQARRLGAERLRAYAAADCRPHNREHVLGLAAWLEPPQGQVDEELLHRFMLFTNDLDTSRGQSFRKSCPELFELIEEAGFPWTDETLHARRQSLPMLAAMPT